MTRDRCPSASTPPAWCGSYQLVTSSFNRPPQGQWISICNELLSAWPVGGDRNDQGKNGRGARRPWGVLDIVILTLFPVPGLGLDPWPTGSSWRLISKKTSSLAKGKAPQAGV